MSMISTYERVLPSTELNRSIIVVIGMHRSGTSLCSNILSVLGVDMADEKETSPSNQSGHWERIDLRALQDEILHLLRREYYSDTHDFPFAPAWWAEPQLRPIITRIENAIAQKLEISEHLGFKDPRTTKLMPIWKRVFSKLKLQPKYILCLRNPAHVAASLANRDGLDKEIGEFRCLDYIVDAFRYTSGQSVCIINYEDWFSHPIETTQRLQAFIGLNGYHEMQDVHIAISSVIRPELNREGQKGAKPQQPLVRNFYDLACRAQKDPACLQEVLQFSEKFLAFKQLLVPFEIVLKRVQNEVALAEGRAAALEASSLAHAAAREATEAARVAAEQTMADLQARHQAMAGERDALRSDLEAAEQRAAAWEASSLAQSAAREAAEVGRVAAEQTMADLQARHQAMAGERDALRSDLEAAEQRAAAWEASSLAHAAAREAAEAGRVAAEQTVADLQARHQAMAGERDALRSRLEAAEQRA